MVVAEAGLLPAFFGEELQQFEVRFGFRIRFANVEFEDELEVDRLGEADFVVALKKGDRHRAGAPTPRGQRIRAGASPRFSTAVSDSLTSRERALARTGWNCLRPAASRAATLDGSDAIPMALSVDG